MRNGQLVKLKPGSSVYFVDADKGMFETYNQYDKSYCIVIGYCNYSRTYELLFDGDVGFNVDPENLEIVK